VLAPDISGVVAARIDTPPDNGVGANSTAPSLACK
jgi:hypothetical protein